MNDDQRVSGFTNAFVVYEFEASQATSINGFKPCGVTYGELIILAVAYRRFNNIIYGSVCLLL